MSKAHPTQTSSTVRKRRKRRRRTKLYDYNNRLINTTYSRTNNLRNRFNRFTTRFNSRRNNIGNYDNAMNQPLSKSTTNLRSFSGQRKLTNKVTVQEPRSFTIRIDPQRAVASIPVFIATSPGILSDIQFTGQVYPLSGSQISQFTGAESRNINKRRRIEISQEGGEFRFAEITRDEMEAADELVNEVTTFGDAGQMETNAPEPPSSINQSLQLVNSPSPITWGLVVLRNGISTGQMEDNFLPPADTNDIINAFNQAGVAGVNDASIVYKPTDDLLAFGSAVVAFSSNFWAPQKIPKTLSNAVVKMNTGDRVYLLLARTAIGDVIQMNANITSRFSFI